MRVIVSAPGRVCLLGEHLDWCGYYVIPAAIDMRVFVEAFPSAGRIVEVHSFSPFQEHESFDLNDIKLDPGSDLRYVGAVLKAMALEKDLPSPDAFTLRFMKAGEVEKDRNAAEPAGHFCDLPVQKGLSSSAALCVAVACAADLTSRPLKSTPPSRKTTKRNLEKSIEQDLARYANLAYVGERTILGVNCGQMDQYAAAYGGILFIDCRKEVPNVTKLGYGGSIPLVIGDSKQQKNTPQILAWLGERFRKREKSFMEGVKAIAKIVVEAAKELDRSDPSLERVGELMNLNQVYLTKNLKVSGDCPISPSNLDKLVVAALSAGALGAKVTGSGGGGCIIALCANDKHKNEVAEAIRKVGGEAYMTGIAQNGLRVELSEP